MKPKQAWKPSYRITPSMARLLMEVERVKEYFENHPLPVSAEAKLRSQARLRATHYSTKIEGNRRTRACSLSAICRCERKFWQPFGG